MAPTSTFFTLPRKLRDEIYEYYAVQPHPYVHEIDSGKLRTSGGDPIDLGLMLVCKPIATEFRGVALRVNTITFRTSLQVHPHPSNKAIRFAAIVDE